MSSSTRVGYQNGPNKGALSLLTCYGDGDSSDDDVPGPRVSTKRTHKGDEDICNKRLSKLPVPDVLKNNKTTPDEYISDPSQHGGRIRTFAHERGNWATYVFIPFKECEGIMELLSVIKDAIPSNIEVKQIDEFHISLTKTVILKHHWIDSFIDSLRKKTFQSKKFMILFNDLKIYCNEERTRTFIGMSIKTGHDSLVKLVEIMNECLGDFNLPHFYEDPSFHMSICWCVGDYEEELNSIISQVNHRFHEMMDFYSQDNWYIYVSFLTCKTGNKYFKFHLT
ncbi:unnamed protein product [Phaedon cochleariae]|uniref:U6 snRNA phosphodiesterase n=1 Tax=Phaedon cochleariae TaxID=80249 RepID=A0A9N9SGF3_PHACE|nr:unnamed protein product [Phaedon cochleariae]